MDDSTVTRPVRWAVLGPGNIARRFATQLPHSQSGTLAGVGSSDPDRARAFAKEFGLGADAVLGTYDDVLESAAIDAVYVSTVHTTHAALTVRALRAGKHVLCEKPLAPNNGQVMTMVDVAREAGNCLVEAYMYRFHPQTRDVLRLVAEQVIGDLVHIDASFAFHSGSTEGRLFDPETAGGGILDVGGYPVSYARAIAGAAAGKPFVEPTAVSADGTHRCHRGGRVDRRPAHVPGWRDRLGPGRGASAGRQHRHRSTAARARSTSPTRGRCPPTRR